MVQRLAETSAIGGHRVQTVVQVCDEGGVVDFVGRAEGLVVTPPSGQVIHRIMVEIARQLGELGIDVYDLGGGGTPRLPGPQEPALFGEGGRGLYMVAAVAGSVGCEGGPMIGHVVWAYLPLDQPSDQCVG
jgi:hypothetical protein